MNWIDPLICHCKDHKIIEPISKLIDYMFVESRVDNGSMFIHEEILSDKMKLLSQTQCPFCQLRYNCRVQNDSSVFQNYSYV